MKILRFQISDYGPLPDRGIFNLDDFNLFFGKNESGKTLTIDGLIKKLVGDVPKQFNNLNRIDYEPEGFIILKEDSRELKLKDNKKVSDFIKITNSEFGRLFIIRDSDLTFRDKKNFYKNVTNTLLGLRLNDIEEVISNIDDLGNLTPTGMFSDKAPYKLKTKIMDAESTIRRIKKLIRELYKQNYDMIEKQITEMIHQQDLVKSEINSYTEAKKRKLYEDSTETYSEFCKNKKICSKNKDFSYKEKSIWIKQKQTIVHTKENLDSLKEELKVLNRKLFAIKREITQKEQDLRRPTKIKMKLDDSINFKLESYRKKFLDNKKSLEKEPLYKHI
ncbi:MAG: hypothetical protein GF311_18730, partial [Candidatus Lokiarchaeota archaeon]|nr:hypothetical protein [Candidatus Lokiarchaeota archaeon]